ncbi:MAG: methyltransferase domain-containing protein [Ktedonobacteraceae bacterium]|nr:methyltransferase domain-containing protein [Ktedonobacteraceae bacterium]
MTSSLPRESTSGINPQPILDMNYAFARTAMLVAAVRLHLFTHLAGGALTSVELAARAHTAPDPTERLLKGLGVLELVEKVGDTYQLTPTADRFLVEDRPSYLGGDTLAMLDYLPAWFQLDETLRTATPYRDLGHAAVAEAFFAPRVRDLFPIIYPLATRAAAVLSIAEPVHMLDVGAGSAPWSAAFAKRYPAARVTALDLPEVVAQGQQHIAEIGLADRYTWIAADMETVTYPAFTYDLIIVGHVCRFIGEDRSRVLLKRLEQSLRPGGTLLLADVFLADDHTGPPPAVTLDLSMLVNTSQGHIWPCSEVSRWLSDAGLHQVQRLDVAGPFPLLIAQKAREVQCAGS